MVAVSNLQHPFMLNLPCGQCCKPLVVMSKGSLLCHLLSICSFQIPSPLQWKKRGMCQVCILCFSLIENREDVEGMQRHFTFCFVGNWISDCTAEFTSRPTPSFFLTGSLENPGVNVPCKKMNFQINQSFLRLFWRTFGLWNKL